MLSTAIADLLSKIAQRRLLVSPREPNGCTWHYTLLASMAILALGLASVSPVLRACNGPPIGFALGIH